MSLANQTPLPAFPRLRLQRRYGTLFLVMQERDEEAEQRMEGSGQRTLRKAIMTVQSVEKTLSITDEDGSED